MSLTDRVRDYDMVDLGIRCEDRTAAASAAPAPGSGAEGGSAGEVKQGEAVPAVVKLDDPAVLRAEREERIRKAAAEAQRKAASKLAAKVRKGGQSCCAHGVLPISDSRFETSLIKGRG